MSLGTAVVGRQLLHVRMSHEGRARALMARLEELSAGPFVRAVERALTDDVAPGERWVFDTLEVDLGVVREDELHLLADRLRRSLSEEVRRRLRRTAARAGAETRPGARAAADVADLSPDGAGRRVAAYLDTGVWSGPIAAPGPDARAPDPLDEALLGPEAAPSGVDGARDADRRPRPSAPEGLLALRPLGSRALERLARQISPAALEQLLQRASPALAAALDTALGCGLGGGPSGGRPLTWPPSFTLTLRHALVQAIAGAFSELSLPEALETLASAVAGGDDARVLQATASHLRANHPGARAASSGGRTTASEACGEEGTGRRAVLQAGSPELGSSFEECHAPATATNLLRDALETWDDDPRTADLFRPGAGGDAAASSSIPRASGGDGLSAGGPGSPPRAPDGVAPGSAQDEAAERVRTPTSSPASHSTARPRLGHHGSDARLGLDGLERPSAFRSPAQTSAWEDPKVRSGAAWGRGAAPSPRPASGGRPGAPALPAGRESRSDARPSGRRPPVPVAERVNPSAPAVTEEGSASVATFNGLPEGLGAGSDEAAAPPLRPIGAGELWTGEDGSSPLRAQEAPASATIGGIPIAATDGYGMGERPQAGGDVAPATGSAAAGRSPTLLLRPAALAGAAPTSSQPVASHAAPPLAVRPGSGSPRSEAHPDETVGVFVQDGSPPGFAASILGKRRSATRGSEDTGQPPHRGTSWDHEASARIAAADPRPSAPTGSICAAYPDAAGVMRAGRAADRISAPSHDPAGLGAGRWPAQPPPPAPAEAAGTPMARGVPPLLGRVRDDEESFGGDGRGSDAAQPPRRTRAAGRRGRASSRMASLPASNGDPIAAHAGAIAGTRPREDGVVGEQAPRGATAAPPDTDASERWAEDRYPAWRSLFLEAEVRARVQGRPAALTALLRVAPRRLMNDLAAEAWGSDRRAAAATDALGRASGLGRGPELARGVLVTHAAAVLRAASPPPPIRIMLSAAAARLLEASPPSLQGHGDGPGLLRRAAAVARLSGDGFAATVLEGVTGPFAPPAARAVRRAGAANAVHYVDNAGLVLVAAYLPALFHRLGLLEHGGDGRHRFKHGDAQDRAAHVLQHLARGRCDDPEPHLLLNKILTGIPFEVPLSRAVVLEPAEEAMCHGLIEAVAANWPALGAASVEGVREAFLQREGRLVRMSEGWRLTVARRTLDVLVDRLPWSFALTFHAWMPEPLHVSW